MLESRMEKGKIEFVDTGTDIAYATQEEGLFAIAERTADPTDPLESLLTKVSLDDPLEISIGDGRVLEISKEQFISYYLPKDATREEKFHCFNQTRAAGLSPLVMGECHYFRTGGNPLRLFTGYTVYLRRAYANGMIHMQQPELTFGENGRPISCAITIQIQNRPDFTSTSWFDEVAGFNRNGDLNARWQRAPNQMLIKCTAVNLLRLSGLVDSALPYIIEEMGEPVADGYRTLTQDQLGAHEPEEATMGEVTAANHQRDLSKERKHYFGRLKKAGIEFASDDERRAFQKEHTGKASTEGWGVEEYLTMGDVISHIRLANKTQGREMEPDTSELTPDDMHSEVEKIVKEVYADSVKAPESDTDPSGDGMAKEEEGKPQEQDKEVADKAMEAWRGTQIRDPQVDSIRELMKEIPEFKDQGFVSPGFPEYAENILGKEFTAIRDLLYEDGRKLIDALEAKLELEDDPEDARLMRIEEIGDLAVKLGWEEGLLSLFVQSVIGATKDWEDLSLEDLEKIVQGARKKVEEKKQISKNEAPDEPFLVTKKTYEAIKDVLIKFPEHRYLTIKSRAFKERAGGIIGSSFTSLKSVLETDAQDILNDLKDEYLEAVEAQAQGQALLDERAVDAAK